MKDIIDQGPEPFVSDIEQSTLENENFRTTLWTGSNLQVTLMSIQPGHEIGREIHEEHDQFLRIEKGQVTVYMESDKEQLQVWQAKVNDAVIVPAGTWHNLVNSGDTPLKLYSIYAPPQHPHGTVHATKEEADIAEIKE